MYAVILSTEATGPVELYRGTDFDAATRAYRETVPAWMYGEPTAWEASGFSDEYGHGSIELAELCPTCGAGNSVNGATHCVLCGADLSDDCATVKAHHTTNLSEFFHGAAFGRSYARYRRREVREAALTAALRDGTPAGFVR
jgi:hypothetical protein